MRNDMVVVFNLLLIIIVIFTVHNTYIDREAVIQSNQKLRGYWYGYHLGSDQRW